MDLELSEEQRQLADSVGRYLADHYDFESRKKIVHSERGLPAERDLYFKAEHRLSTYVKLACHAGMIVA